MRLGLPAMCLGRLCFVLAALLSFDAVRAASKPNIVWITAEDICPNLGCYGDPDAVTPNLDRFAAGGVRFTNVFSVHPCCSPSRSCLATSVYPTRLGTFQHRGKMWVAAELVKCFPTLLRQSGYYCFNGAQGGTAKLDYNFEPADKPWDKIGSKQVEWRNRQPGQPFFGQINLACTHQSQYGQIAPGTPRAGRKDAVHDPAEIHVPPYHTDTPAVRQIWADYHDRITRMDREFDGILRRLSDDELADDTIIFFFGDNGHGIPGGKVWLWDQGPHVPLVVRFPKKWQHLAPSPPGSVSNRLVSFLDFAPTVLSLAGLDIPPWMQGVAAMGPKAGPERKYAFAARDFHDGADFDTCRMARDLRYHYLRNFMPHLGWDAIQYSWQKAPHMLQQWRGQAEAGKLAAGTRQACFFRRAKPSEELYDMQQDPYQMHNLAGDPQHQDALLRLRNACEAWMIENHDLGLLSQYELYVRSEEDSPYQMAADPQRNPTKRLLDAANLANRRDPASAGALVERMKDSDPAVRRWGVIGLLALGQQAAPVVDALLVALKDSSPDVRMTAAEALCGLGLAEVAVPVLADLLEHESRIIRNETLLALCRIGPPAKAALPHLDKAAGPSQHEKLWSHDNIPDAIRLAKACISDEPSELKATRQKCLP